MILSWRRSHLIYLMIFLIILPLDEIKILCTTIIFNCFLHTYFPLHIDSYLYKATSVLHVNLLSVITSCTVSCKRLITAALQNPMLSFFNFSFHFLVSHPLFLLFFCFCSSFSPTICFLLLSVLTAYNKTHLDVW